MEIYLGNKRLSLQPSDSIAKGGEADIFRIDQDQVLKVFKTPKHPDLAGRQEEQDAAKFRLEQHQQKLPALLKKSLPMSTIGPDELAYTGRKSRAVGGYAMRFIDGANTLLSYTDMNFKKSITYEVLMSVLRDLHQSVKDVHSSGLVIGDFNDLNVLVLGDKVFLIDVDSYQFDQWYSYVYTQRFLDPLLAKIDAQGLALHQPYVPNADWYAYSVMVMQVLLSAGPYSGIVNKKNPQGRRYKFHERVDDRITVYDSSVGYPRNAVPCDYLPDDLNHYLHQVFVKDERGEFPTQLLQFQWQKCDTCGIWHARPTCPGCAKPAPAAVKQKVQIQGNVTSTRIFRTHGNILFATIDSGELQYLYWENNQFFREGGVKVLDGPMDPLYRYRIQRERTLVGKQNRVAILQPSKPVSMLPVDSFGNLAMFDANRDSIFWLKAGHLLKEHMMGQEQIGDVLTNQTLFWVGNKKGFGFYNAGEINIAFMFNPNARGLRDNLAPLNIRGQLVDSTVVFGVETIWVFYSVNEQGKIVNRCRVYSFKGEVLAEAEADQGDDSWLGTIRGKTAIGNRILSVTPEGIVKVNAKQGIAVESEFPTTEPFVHVGCHLFANPKGLHVVDNREIRILTIK